MPDYEFKNFYVYNLEDDGTYNEIKIEQENLAEILTDDEVLLIVKEDNRRLFIWKGPKASVRKRFISSRVASNLQEEVRKKTGMHLKILSIDAGEEPVEFLSLFNLQPYEVTEKLPDMVYIRNIDREKMEQEQLKQNIEKRKKETAAAEYTSPLLQQADQTEIVKSNINIQESQSARAMTNKQTIDYSDYVAPSITQPKTTTKYNEKEILESILQTTPPNGYDRMNIIIGKNLYAPKVIQTVVLGKSIEKKEWNVVEDLPGGVIDLKMDFLRIYIDEKNKIIKAIELYQNNCIKDSKNDLESKNNSSQNSENSSTTRKLPQVPKAN